MDRLIELAERCERATGPDEVLDGMIEAELHVGFPLDLSQFVEGVPVEWEADDETGAVSIYIGKRKHKRYRAPAFTASLDAAMTLVPEGRRLELVTFEDGSANALVRGGKWFGNGATPALALCAASLRARAPQGEPR